MFRFSYLCRLRDSISLTTKISGSRHADCAFDRPVVWLRASTSVNMSSEPDIKNYFEFAKELVLKTGETFKCGFEGEKVVETKAHEWDLVTDYDKKIEELLISGLKAKFPDHEFIGEESMADAKEKPVLTDKPTWILDPIDGTVNYINSFPQTCISLGLTVCKEVVVGIIYNPIVSDLYTAVKGQGAFLNEKPIRSSCVAELKEALIEIELASLRFPGKNRDVRMGRFEACIQATRGVRYLGSAAMGLAHVARGALDGFQMDPLKPWDVAAGILIVREAGGTVLNAKGDKYDVMKPDTIAAGNAELASKLQQLIIDTDLKVLRKRLTRS
ncbi:uncharacterized protein LOC143373274 [Andrena cerasifolii]|uniref:uncharacterized protein LOC143373274 n=1 Tax=Andrena cerasifolii TaxID=2819439 RepID=UPI004037DA51